MARVLLHFFAVKEETSNMIEMALIIESWAGLWSPHCIHPYCAPLAKVKSLENTAGFVL